VFVVGVLVVAKVVEGFATQRVREARAPGAAGDAVDAARLDAVDDRARSVAAAVAARHGGGGARLHPGKDPAARRHPRAERRRHTGADPAARRRAREERLRGAGAPAAGVDLIAIDAAVVEADVGDGVAEVFGGAVVSVVGDAVARDSRLVFHINMRTLFSDPGLANCRRRAHVRASSRA